MRDLGEAATHLRWLCPCAASLSALARAPTEAWATVRRDPAAVLLVVRCAAATLTEPARAAFHTLVNDPEVAEQAIALLEEAGDRVRFVDWAVPEVRPVYTAALHTAATAEHVAQATGLCDPSTAWVAGMLAPLGWLALSALDPQRTQSCREDPCHVRHAGETETRSWGLTAQALGRRLAQQWRLPRWLAALLGHLSLPAEHAERFGAPGGLFRVVQFAVVLTQQAGQANLHLPVVTPSGSLGLPPERTASLVQQALASLPAENAWVHPREVPLLRDLLQLAADNRRLRNVPALAELQQEVDQLHHALESQLATEAQRLRTQKLGALAEFAAGAGHEINNPLAVISGQAQYLLKKLAEYRLQHAEQPDPTGASSLHAAIEPALQTVIQQTRRIHQILTELMQFARPPRLHKEDVDAVDLVREVAATLVDSATRSQVQLVCPEPASPVPLHADPQQVRTALTCLLRNAVESAPPGGWAGVRVECSDPEYVELVVEDNGAGPAPAQREHLFDPFYSGRHAGRGRGLGLPTAWRLAREHGGDVRFEGRTGSPTRFILSLPRRNGTNGNGLHGSCENGHRMPDG